MGSAMALTIALSVATVFLCFLLHFEALRLLTGATVRSPSRPRVVLAIAMAGLVSVHIAEIALFAVAFYASVRLFGLGSFVESRSMMPVDYFYYAAETYSSLGYGDIYPLGDVRLLASITPLVGILLLGWSGAFLFSLVRIDGANE
jgi:hypothetical protein